MRAITVSLVVLLGLCVGSTGEAAATLELFPTFNAMGVTVTIGAGDDPDQDLVAAVSVRVQGGTFRAGLPLARVGAARLVGSVLWLQPGTVHDVRVAFVDPDGGPLNGTAVEGSATTRAEITVPVATRSLAVSPTGSGTACSAAAPCRIAEALSQVQPGEEIVLQAGVYHEGGFTLPRSGQAGRPIVIRAATRGAAILDGAQTEALAWVAQGGGMYSTTTQASAPHMVLANGKRLFPYGSLADLQSLRWGVPGFFASGTSLSVRLAGDADPTAASMVVSRHEICFEVDSQGFIYFVDLTFRHFGAGEYPKTIYLIESSDNLVQSCTFASCDLGVGLKYGSHRNVIQDNEFYDTIADFPWAGVKEVEGLEDGGVYVYSPMDGRGTVIRRNVFHDDFDGFHVCPWDPGPTNEIDIYENTMYRMGDDGLETDGECSNVRIWNNTVHDVLMGISLAPVQTGPVYAVGNTIYGIGRNASEEGGGSGFKLNSGYDQSGPIYLFHNTVDARNAGNSALTLYEPGSWKALVARNNIWSGTSYALEHYNTSQPVDLDFDDLYTTRAGELVWWQGLAETHLRTLAALRSATGQELHGLSVAPGFAGPATGDYSLAAGSPLIDQGVAIAGINDGFAGAAPDIGAREYRGSTGCSIGCSADVPTTAQATVSVLLQASATTSGCTGSPIWEWDFGDGSSHATAQSPTHAYATPGTYTWRLTVRADGASCQRSGAITIGSPPPPATYIVPAVAHLPGAGGTRWRTDLGAVNRSGTAAALTLTYYSSAAPVVRSTSLIHGAAQEWKDVLTSLFGLAGAAQSSGVVHLVSTMPLAVSARTYNQTTTGTYGQSYPGLRPADAITPERPGVLPQLRKSAAFRTNIGVVNLGSATASARVTLYNAAGGKVGSTKSLTAEAGRWVQQYDIFADVGAGSQEVAYAVVEVLTAGGRMWAYASLIDVATGDPTTIPVLVP